MNSTNWFIIKIGSGNKETPGKQENRCAFEFVDVLIAMAKHVTPFYTNKMFEVHLS